MFLLSLDGLNRQGSVAAKGSEPWPLTFLEFAQNARFKIDDRCDPFVRITFIVVGCRQYCDMRFSDIPPDADSSSHGRG